MIMLGLLYQYLRMYPYYHELTDRPLRENDLQF